MSSKTSTTYLEEAAFIEAVEKMTVDSINYGPKIITKSKQASYFARTFNLGNGIPTRIVLHLTDIDLSFKVSENKNENSGEIVAKMKASFKYDENKPIHRALKKLDDLSKEKVKSILGDKKPLTGIIQTSVTVKDDLTGKEDTTPIEPRVWISVPQKDRALKASFAGCKIMVTTFDGKNSSTVTENEINVKTFISKHGKTFNGDSFYINFDNYTILQNEIKFACDFNIFKTIGLIPHVRSNATEDNELKLRMEKKVRENNIINNIKPEELEISYTEEINTNTSDFDI